MSNKINRNEFIKSAVLTTMAASAFALGPVTLAHAQAEHAIWEANLGKVKDLNEKQPVLVKAQFKDVDGNLMDEEKVFVRWEQVNRSIGRWIVLSAFCTHLKCVIDFDENEGIFQCPCHGSQYDLEGTVLKRPAKHSLDNYSELVEERDDNLILKREPY